MSTPSPNVHPMVRVGTAAHFKLYNNAWHRTEKYPGKCSCGIDPIHATVVRPSIDDSWRYVPDTSWGSCLSKLAKHDEANYTSIDRVHVASLKDGAMLVIGMRVQFDDDVAHNYEQGKSGEWYLETVARDQNGDGVPVARLREKVTGVFVHAPLHWLTEWKEPEPEPDPDPQPDTLYSVRVAFVLETTSDARLACFLCKKEQCTHEFTFRGEGDRVAIGAHEACLCAITGATPQRLV